MTGGKEPPVRFGAILGTIIALAVAAESAPRSGAEAEPRDTR
jgi:hypothetical protein